MYVEEGVYEMTNGTAGYKHSPDTSTRNLLTQMVKAFLSTISHDERLNVDKLCFLLLTAERRLVYENVFELLKELIDYKGEMWLNMRLSRGGGSGCIAYFYFLIRSVFSVCDQVRGFGSQGLNHKLCCFRLTLLTPHFPPKRSDRQAHPEPAFQFRFHDNVDRA
jgi:hypothetical protein